MKRDFSINSLTDLNKDRAARSEKMDSNQNLCEFNLPRKLRTSFAYRYSVKMKSIKRVLSEPMQLVPSLFLRQKWNYHLEKKWTSKFEVFDNEVI